MTTETDTIKLLKECDSGSKMAVAAIDEVLDKTQNQKLVDLLNESKNHHSELGNKLHSLLMDYGSDDKDPNIMAKGMSWMKTNWKMEMNNNDNTVADLITDGCNMGIKSLNKYLNQYSNSDEKAKDICHNLISIETELRDQLTQYL